jgi:undecaprenyl diphosphate synthase
MFMAVFFYRPKVILSSNRRVTFEPGDGIMKKFGKLPKHIGIIPDGNRRWAVARGMKKEEGYFYGLKPGMELFRIGQELRIEEVSIYAFTQENTHRAKEQVAAFRNAVIEFVEDLEDEDVSALVVGDFGSPLFPE